MAAKYTYSYDDFKKALDESGLGASFSDADLRLATVNPDAGMSILNSKIGYNGATSDAQRQQYNQQAEDVRRQYGGYTGGVDGSLYQLEPMSPSGYQQTEAPSYQNNYNGQMQSLLNKQLTYGSFNDNTTKPVYQNRYDGQIQEALGKVTNPDPFSYNPETDPSYASYAKAYRREGERATADAMGQAAAASGGLPSSYAMTAAQQAGNYYAAQMADKIPELEQMAYARYQNEYAMRQAALDALMGAEAADYAKYQTDLGQYNADRDFGYQVYMNEYNRILNDLATVRDMESTDYGRHLDALDQYNADRQFGYGQYLDEIDYQTLRRQEAAQAAQQRLENDYLRAEAGAAVGDYGGYRDLGYDTAYAEELKQLGLLQEQASLDYSGKAQQLEFADMAAKYGDTSYLVALGITPSTSALGAAAQQSPEDTAKYMNFMLGYWDEPGVREFIQGMTGLDVERYAEYVNLTEGNEYEIVYKPTARTGGELVEPGSTSDSVILPTFAAATLNPIPEKETEQNTFEGEIELLEDGGLPYPYRKTYGTTKAYLISQGATDEEITNMMTKAEFNLVASKAFEGKGAGRQWDYTYEQYLQDYVTNLHH